MRDLSDPYEADRRQQRDVRRQKSSTMLQNSSITQGGLRVASADGILAQSVAGGAPAVRVTGLQVVDGVLRIRGTIDGDGDFEWEGTFTNGGPLVQNGAWRMVGDGDIEGDVDLTGVFKVAGTLPIVLRSVAGQARIEAGTGYIAGLNGAIVMTTPNGGQFASSSGGASMVHGGNAVEVGADGVTLNGSVRLTVTPGGLPAGVTGTYLLRGSDGRIYAGSAGGGGGGDTPPNPLPGGYVWPADPAIHGISDDYQDHKARGSAEPGTDVACGVGTAIYAPADGRVVSVNTAPSGATGRLVVFRASNGAWFRMLHLSSISVSANQEVKQGALLGRSGGSGFGSEAYYGPHLHLTYLPGPSDTQPPLSTSADFELVMAAQWSSRR